MKDSIRLGRLGGISIGVNWSLAVIVVLLSFGLAVNRFPLEAPGAGRTACAVAGVLTAVALLVTVLLHELGHAVVARRNGMTVDGITLSWLGGVTRIEGESAKPSVELAISAVGPVVSVGLGAILALIRLPVAEADHRLVGAALGWLAVINVALAVFNLVPAAPLDGGRVVHAAIWAVTGDRWKATRWTSRAGVFLGAAMVVYGFGRALTPNGELDGVVSALLGTWILSSARAEEQAGILQSSLEGLRVCDLMRPVGAAPGWMTARTFIEHYDSVHPGWVWLLQSWDRPGFATVVAGETVRATSPQHWDHLRPQDVAISTALALPARPGEALIDALRRTDGRQMLLAVEDGRTVGAVMPADVDVRVSSSARARSFPRSARARTP